MDLEKVLQASDRCIHEAPSACTSTCPVHVDVRSLAEEIEKGDFIKAYKILEKKLPFPRILGRICDHPCEGVCVRKSIGGAIEISQLETATVVYGYTAPKKMLPVPKNKKKIAVVGGGLSGMTAAVDLAKKGYEITIYEKSNKLGGQIWAHTEKVSKDIIEEEINNIEKKGIKILYNTLVDPQALQNLLLEYDGIYLGTGTWAQDLHIDPVTYQVDNIGVFAGGRLATKKKSAIFSASAGRRAAISIERYIKGVSMTASRDLEGSFETPLKMNLDEIPEKKATKKSEEIYSEEEAVKEAKRCLKCQCSKCKDVCTHLQEFNIIPKNYTRNINHNERIILGTHHANKMINACTQCGLCTEVCDDNVDMKQIIKETRQSMAQRGKMPISAHDFALRDMEFSNSSRFFMARKQPGKEKVKYVFYPGCQLPASHPEYISEIYKYLMAKVEEGVGLMLGCCGAPANWGGRLDLLSEGADQIKQEWEKMGKPTFILACSSCMETFTEALQDIPFISLWEVIDRYGIPENTTMQQGKLLNLHDACATRYNNEVHESVRRIVSKIGCEIQELKYSKNLTKCCGYGGLVYYANRDHAKKFVRDRIEETSHDLLVYCAMCKDLFIEGGKKSFHILDLLFAVDMNKVSLRSIPSISQRHENRMNVKRMILQDIWGELPSMDIEQKSDYRIVLSEEAMKLIEKRYILVEDVEKIIENSIEKEECLYNPENKEFLAKLRIGHVTYWARYEKVGKEILVKSAYSHRMEVMEEEI